MESRLIFLPALAMAALTFVVWVRLYVVRIGEMKRERIDPQSVATSAGMAARVNDTRASDNFRNLFEVAALTQQVTAATLGLAWLFVGLRVMHSAIHCTYNKVMHRFPVHFASTLVLWALWGVLAVGLLRR